MTRGVTNDVLYRGMRESVDLYMANKQRSRLKVTLAGKEYGEYVRCSACRRRMDYGEDIINCKRDDKIIQLCRQCVFFIDYVCGRYA